MCINLKTSLLAFGVGTGSGYLLTTKSMEKKMMGFFIMFYSLIQLFEAGIYWSNGDNPLLYSQLIMINLGFQGLIFFLLMNQIYNFTSFYIIVCLTISLYMLLKALSLQNSNNERLIETDKCIKWNFLGDNSSKVLTLMYGLILYWFWFENKITDLNIDNQFIHNIGIGLTITMLYSYFLTRNCYSPGVWCLSSAIMAPVFLYL